MLVRKGERRDVELINSIARQYNVELGYLPKVKIRECIDRGDCHVAICNDTVVGFVLFRSRLDNTRTIYDIAVDSDYVNMGIGRQLLYSVPCPMQLKTTVDNYVARRFYIRSGMYCGGFEEGNKRRLVSYKRDVLGVYVFGNSSVGPSIAMNSGMAYGVAQGHSNYGNAYMLDVEFREEERDWAIFLEEVKRYKPVQALVSDYLRVEEKGKMLSELNDLSELGVLNIIVCPKFDGAMRDIPAQCIVGLSIPTNSKKFSGFLPELEALSREAKQGRRFHLLGGSPHIQHYMMKLITDLGGQVISYDINSHEFAAKRGTIWNAGRWFSPEGWYFDEDKLPNTISLSGRNIVRFMNNQTTTLPIHKGGCTRRINQLEGVYGHSEDYIKYLFNTPLRTLMKP